MKPRPRSFCEKLGALLDDPSLHDAIRWSPDGQEIYVAHDAIARLGRVGRWPWQTASLANWIRNLHSHGFSMQTLKANINQDGTAGAPSDIVIRHDYMRRGCDYGAVRRIPCKSRSRGQEEDDEEEEEEEEREEGQNVMYEECKKWQRRDVVPRRRRRWQRQRSRSRERAPAAAAAPIFEPNLSELPPPPPPLLLPWLTGLEGEKDDCCGNGDDGDSLPWSLPFELPTVVATAAATRLPQLPPPAVYCPDPDCLCWMNDATCRKTAPPQDGDGADWDFTLLASGDI